MAAFGPNEWLVDELYQQYLQDKNSVDQAWWEFFADYQPPDGHGGNTNSEGAATATPSAAPQSLSASAPAASPAPAPASATPVAAATHPAADAVEPVKSPPKPRDVPAARPPGPPSEDEVQPLRGAAARTVANMESSLTVPTATSLRAIPAKLLIDNRVVINNHLARSRGG